MQGTIPAWVLFLHLRYREKPRITKRGCRQRRGGSARVLRTSSLSAPRRQPREISTARAGPAEAPRRLSPLLARKTLSGGPIHPHCRLRDLSGGQACLALAGGSGYRHRLQRNQRALLPRSSSGNTSLNNLQVRQLPIERAGDLNASFDQIICTGVLHHLADPDAGLARPARVCSSRTEARCISWCMRLTDGPASTCCRSSAGGSASVPTTRKSAISSTALKALPPGHPLESSAARRPGFPRRGGARRRAAASAGPRLFGAAVIRASSKQAGLTFGRWLKQAPYSPHCGVVARIPQASRLAQLSLAEQYAAVELFRGTMVRHSVIAYRDDSPLAARSG